MITSKMNNYKRKQRVIKNCRELQEIERDSVVENVIYKSLELIGIYENYQGSDEEFYSTYCKETDTPRYHYRNKGVDIIYEKIINRDIKDYRITKRSMKRTGICFVTRRVYEGTDIIVNAIIDYFKENDFLYDFYAHHIHRQDVFEYLLFQHDCLVTHRMIHSGINTEYFTDMETRIEKEIEI